MEEKLSILSQMIDLAKSDENIATTEYNFLLAIADQLGVSQTDFDVLINNPAPEVNLQPEAARIVQFHRLVLLMNVDQKNTEIEEAYLYRIGLKFGLPMQAIQQTLAVMHNYENKMIPPNVLMDIFKAHYN